MRSHRLLAIATLALAVGLALPGCTDEPPMAPDAAVSSGAEFELEPGATPIAPVVGRCSFLAADAPRCCLLACEGLEASFRAECAPPPGSCSDFACPLRGGGFEEPAPSLCTPHGV